MIQNETSTLLHKASESAWVAHMEASDHTLLLRYRRGDRRALTELVRRYGTPLYTYLLRQLGTPTLAEDATRRIFVALGADEEMPDERDRVATWLFSLAHDICRRERGRMASVRFGSLSRRQMEEDLERRLEALDTTSKGAVELDAEALPDDSVVLAIDALPEQERDVLLLREIAALPVSQIARVLGIGEAVVRLRLLQALERLRHTLQNFEPYQRALG